MFTQTAAARWAWLPDGTSTKETPHKRIRHIHYRTGLRPGRIVNSRALQYVIWLIAGRADRARLRLPVSQQTSDQGAHQIRGTSCSARNGAKTVAASGFAPQSGRTTR